MTLEPVNPRAALAIALAPPLELEEEALGVGLLEPEELPLGDVGFFVGEEVRGPGLKVEEGDGAPLGVKGPLMPAEVKPLGDWAAKDVDV